MQRIYLDVSCLSRPNDDQQQARIRLETEAIAIIMEGFEEGRWLHLASDMTIIEINANTDPNRRRCAYALLPDRSTVGALNDAIWVRAKKCEEFGIKPADAVHVAAAESMHADVLLTCDDRLVKAAQRNRARLHVKVANRLSWLKEQDNDSNT